MMDRVNDDSSLKFCSAFNPPLFCNNDELFEKIDPAHLLNFSLDQTIRLIIKNIINVTLLMANFMRFKNRWECLVGRVGCSLVSKNDFLDRCFKHFDSKSHRFCDISRQIIAIVFKWVIWLKVFRVLFHRKKSQLPF